MKDSNTLLTMFPLPEDIPSVLHQELVSEARVAMLDPGTRYLQADMAVETFALVTEGLLRVFRADENGREITLYTVGPGECCVINVLSLLSHRASVAEAVVEETTEALVYPGGQFRRWMAEHESMRTFVFGLLSDRVGGMMALIEEVAFQKMDRRLASLSLPKSPSAPP